MDVTIVSALVAIVSSPLTPRECGRHLEELMTAYDLTRITAARERRDLRAALDREAVA